MLQTLARQFRAYRQHRFALRRLRRLDDWLLADMGTSRDRLADFVRGNAKHTDL